MTNLLMNLSKEKLKWFNNNGSNNSSSEYFYLFFVLRWQLQNSAVHNKNSTNMLIDVNVLIWKPLTIVTGSSIPGIAIVLKFLSVKQNIKTAKI